MDNRSTRRWLTNELLPRRLNLGGFIRGIAAIVKMGTPRIRAGSGAGIARARRGIITPFACRLFVHTVAKRGRPVPEYGSRVVGAGQDGQTDPGLPFHPMQPIAPRQSPRTR